MITYLINAVKGINRVFVSVPLKLCEPGMLEAGQGEHMQRAYSRKRPLGSVGRGGAQCCEREWGAGRSRHAGVQKP